MIKGINIVVYEDGVAFAAARSCDIEVNHEVKEKSSATHGKWKDYKSGRFGWAVNVSGLVTSIGKLLHNGQKVRMTMAVRDDEGVFGEDSMVGYAICTAARIIAKSGTLAQMSCTFRGTGELAPQIWYLRDTNSLDLHDVDGQQLRSPGVHQQ